MAISDPTDPIALRRAAGEKIQKAKGLSEQLDDPACDFTMDQRAKTEERIETLLGEAQAERDKADDLEQRERQRAQTRGRIGSTLAEVSKPRRQTRPGSPEPAYNGSPLNRGFRDMDGKPVAMLAHGESLADWNGRQYGQTQDTPRLGEVVRSLITGSWDAGFDTYQALSQGQDSTGGFYLAPQISDTFIDLARAESVVTQAGAQTFSMNAPEQHLVRVLTDPTVAWTGENNTLTESDPTFGRLTLRARKMGVYVKMSRELVEDAPNAAQQIERLLTIAASQELDRVALLGDADGEEPTGLFNYPGVTDNAIGGAVDFDDMLDTLAALEGRNVTPTAVIYSPLVKSYLAKLKVNSEANHYAMAPADIAAISRYTTTKLANTQAIMGDFRELLIGVRSEVRIETTSLAAGSGTGPFERDQIWVKLTWRGDVQPMRANHFETLTGISG